MPIEKRQLRIDVKDFPIAHPIQPADTRFSFGDAHGHALKILFSLVQHGFAQMTPADYRRFAEICEDNPSTFDYVLSKDTLSPTERARIAGMIAEMRDIVGRIEFNPNAGMLDALGDVWCDRGPCDFYTALLMDGVVRAGINIQEELSNHSVEYFRAVQEYDAAVGLTAPVLMNGHDRSTVNLAKMIKHGLVDIAEVKEMMSRYAPKVRIVSASVVLNGERKSVVISSHAAIGLNNIQDLARYFNVAYDDSTPEKLVETVAGINLVFSHRFRGGQLEQMCPSDELQRGYEGAPIDSASQPVAFATWNREYSQLQRPPVHAAGYEITYEHGHDSDDLEPAGVVNLDNSLAKRWGSTEGWYFYTAERVVPQQVRAVAASTAVQPSRPGAPSAPFLTTPQVAPVFPAVGYGFPAAPPLFGAVDSQFPQAQQPVFPVPGGAPDSTMAALQRQLAAEEADIALQEAELARGLQETAALKQESSARLEAVTRERDARVGELIARVNDLERRVLARGINIRRIPILPIPTDLSLVVVPQLSAKFDTLLSLMNTDDTMRRNVTGMRAREISILTSSYYEEFRTLHEKLDPEIFQNGSAQRILITNIRRELDSLLERKDEPIGIEGLLRGVAQTRHHMAAILEGGGRPVPLLSTIEQVNLLLEQFNASLASWKNSFETSPEPYYNLMKAKIMALNFEQGSPVRDKINSLVGECDKAETLEERVLAARVLGSFENYLENLGRWPHVAVDMQVSRRFLEHDIQLLQGQPNAILRGIGAAVLLAATTIAILLAATFSSAALGLMVVPAVLMEVAPTVAATTAGAFLAGGCGFWAGGASKACASAHATLDAIDKHEVPALGMVR